MPTLLTRGVPGNGEHERRRVTRGGLWGAVHGHGGDDRGDHTPVVKHDLSAGHGHRITERNGGLKSFSAAAIHHDDRGPADLAQRRQNVETGSVRGHPRHRAVDVRFPQAPAVRRHGRQPPIGGARGAGRDQSMAHSRRGADFASQIMGPNEPAVRRPARLDGRSERHDEQIVAQQRGTQEKAARRPGERPPPQRLAVAHRDELGVRGLFPPEKITGGVAHERGTNVRSIRRGFIDPALRAGWDRLGRCLRVDGRRPQPTRSGERAEAERRSHEEPPVGLEPTTARLRIESSTTELRWRTGFLS